MFILDDPRFLEGGVNNHYEMNYTTPLITYDSHTKLVDTKAVMSTIDSLAINKPTTLRELAGSTVRLFDSSVRKNLLEYVLGACYNQSIHCGRNSYHHRPSYNVFVPRNDAFPSVGVELEMMKKQKVPDSELAIQLKSNWFHFERDGSLGDSGYEAITEPLPAKCYRDLDLWLGLQSIFSQYFISYNSPDTGFHIHVGKSIFIDSVKNVSEEDGVVNQTLEPSEIDTLACLLLAYLYTVVIPRNIIDEIFLRDPTTYCTPIEPSVSQKWTSKTEMTVNEVVLDALCVADERSAPTASSYLPQSKDVSSLSPKEVMRQLRQCRFYTYSWRSNLPGGHGSELNFDPANTIEFRRGKGTLNAVSLHRMVEFASLLVTLTAELLSFPDLRITRDYVLKYISERTYSQALKNTLN